LSVRIGGCPLKVALGYPLFPAKGGGLAYPLIPLRGGGGLTCPLAWF